MPEDTQVLRRIQWADCFPFTHVFRTFRLAAQPSKLVLALAIVIGTLVWGSLLDRAWMAAGHGALEGEIHGYPVTSDYDAWRAGFARAKTDTLAALVRDLKSGTKIDEVRKAIEQDRGAVVKDANNLLNTKFEKQIDPDARAELDAESLKKLSDDEREAELNKRVAASLAEYRTLKAQLDSLSEGGIFRELRRYEQRYIQEVFHAARGLSFYRESDFDVIGAKGGRVGSIEATVSGAGPIEGLSVTGNLCMMGRGLAWLGREHSCYAVFFLLGTLAIWAYFGGAICRIAALHAARDERISIFQALGFGKQKFVGFYCSPLIVTVLTLLVGLVLLIGGVVAAVPVLDIVGGLFFFLALIGGAIMAILIIGLVGGVSLMWPTIAVEGSDAFDAISRSYSYVLAKPWRSLLYASVAFLYGAFCILFVRVFLWLTLACTHAAVGAGTGWADRPEAGPGLDKLDVMWAAPSPSSLAPHADWASLSGTDWLGAVLITVWVGLLACLLYAFAISFYFSGSTIIYYLLRRDVDATDMEDVYLEEYGEKDFEPVQAPAESGKPSEATGPAESAGESKTE